MKIFKITNIENKKCLLSLLLITVILCGCADQTENTFESSETENTDTDEVLLSLDDQTASDSDVLQHNKYDDLLSSMTTEEKVAQLFFIRPEQLIDDSYVNDEAIVGSEGEGAVYVSDNIKTMYEKYPVGGFVLFAKNIDTPEQLMSFTHDLKSLGEINTLIAIDEEGGIVTRIAQNDNFNVPYIDTMESIGITGDESNAYFAGDTIGEYLADYGIFWDFAPVADLNTNPDNIVIGSRSFGSDAQLSSGMVRSYIDGLHAHGVKSTLKHFPGHGDTSEDTHSGYVCLNKTWEELSETELVPFVLNLDRTDAVMAAHITLPGVTDDGLPCSMSYDVITGKLRGELGFNGVVVTDSLAMRAITDSYSSGEASVMAFEAGCDVLLTPQNFYEAYKGVLDAVESGEIAVERLDQSVGRILALKDIE